MRKADRAPFSLVQIDHFGHHDLTQAVLAKAFPIPHHSEHWQKACALPQEVLDHYSQYSSRDISARLRNGMGWVGEQVVGREDLIEQTQLALLMRVHQLILSIPGEAKSMYVQAVVSLFEGAKVFKKQFDKFDTADAVVGMPDLAAFKRNEFRHNTKESLVAADFAFLDEMFNANDALLTTMNGILNERWFLKGEQQEWAHLHTAIATSNYMRFSETTAPIIDRFPLRTILNGESDPYFQLKVDQAYAEHHGVLPSPPSDCRCLMTELDYMSAIVAGRVPGKEVRIPSHVLFLKDYIADKFAAKVQAREGGSDRFVIGKRTRAKARDLLAAQAVMKGRDQVETEDLDALRHMFATVGDPKIEPGTFNSIKQSSLVEIREDDRNCIDQISEVMHLMKQINHALRHGYKPERSFWEHALKFFRLTSEGALTYKEVNARLAEIKPQNERVKQLHLGLHADIQKHQQIRNRQATDPILS